MRRKLKEAAGFTLVELIVVIAILGILASVGGVAYAGYVERANKAVDEQLVADVKYAAILGGMQDPGISGKIDLTHSGITVTGDDADMTATIQKWLTDAFGDGWSSRSTKVLDAVVYVPVMTVELSEEQQQMVQDYINSNFYGNEEQLAQSVGDLTGMFSNWLAGGNDLASYIPDYEEFKRTYGLTDDSSPDEVANAVVLYVASKASGMNAEDIFNRAQSGDMTGIMNDYGMLPTAALMYGVMTGYANSEYASEDFKSKYATKPEGISDVMDLLNEMNRDPGVSDYMNSASDKNAISDMKGYLGAMELVNDNSGKFDISDPDAFNNNTTLALLQAILAAGSK